ncbi:MAG: hypothetical protein AABZ39_06690, partial [Spirochaetota bacterium]
MKHTLVLVLFVTALLFPVRTQFFSSVRSDFYDRGKQSGVAVDQRNGMTLSPRLRKVAGIAKDYVWRLAADDRGTVYAATGHGGVLYKKEQSADRFSEFAKVPDAEITAVAVDGAGTVYAAGAPKAVLYRVGRNGEVSAMPRTNDLYFWDIVAAGDDLYIAAGGVTGKIYKFSKGAFTEVLVTKEQHVTALSYDKKSGDLYASTEGKGMIYRIAKSGAVHVLYTPPEDEVHTVALLPDGIVVAGTASREIDTKSTDTKSTGVGEKKARRNALYSIHPSGVFDKLYSFTDTVLLSLLSDDDGSVLIGTGDKGELYRIENGVISLVAKLEEKQILSMVRVNGVVYCATGSGGG